MKTPRPVLLAILLTALGYFLSAVPTAMAVGEAAPQGTATQRDGQHDFDFNIGTWKTHIRRLLHPLTGSTTWLELNGAASVREIWDGRAQLEEVEADGPTGHFEDLQLFLYRPESHQWTLSFANSAVGTLSEPAIGEFKNGQAEFYDQETLNGRAILVRIIWSDITPDSHRFEQSFSDDGGKTWEANFIANVTREKELENKLPSPQVSESSDGTHDFDFNFGKWKTHITRLVHPLSSSQTWVDYDGTSDVSKVWNGRASLFELEASGPSGRVEGVGLRLYNPKSRQWSLNWANGRDGIMGTPMVGEFAHGRGEFYDQEEFQGRIIFSRNGFYDIKPDSSRFEQAFSGDEGKTWETNWIMTFTR
jgi:hypothetical protein